MTIIQKAAATQAAKERLVYTLRTYLPTELATLLSGTGVDLPVPEDAAYFLSSIRIDREILGRHPVVCLVEQVRPFRGSRDLTVLGDDYGIEGELPLRVRLAFTATTSYMPLEVQGKVQTREEWMQWCAEKYRGAVINAIFGRAVDNYSIADVVLEADMSFGDLLPEDQGLEAGGCLVELAILQTVTVPAAVRS